MSTKIEWADRTWNPITGCSKISAGCQNCYAERMSKRLAGRCGYDKDEPFKVTFHTDRLDEPLRWRKPSRIFVCSMGDLFHEDVPDELIYKVFNTMSNAQFIHGHTFMILTKRPERMMKIIMDIKNMLDEQSEPIELPNGLRRYSMTFVFPLNNIWLGVTAENQEMADKRIPILLQIPAEKRFVSVEPMLSGLNITKYLGLISGCQIHCMDTKSTCRLHSGECKDAHDNQPGIDWLICGGETGSGARPVHPDWARSLRDQCQAAGVPFFFKSWGDWYPDKKGIYERAESVIFGNTVVHRIGKKAAGRLLDDQEWNEIPEV